MTASEPQGLGEGEKKQAQNAFASHAEWNELVQNAHRSAKVQGRGGTLWHAAI
jgi:hypothetical protein